MLTFGSCSKKDEENVSKIKTKSETTEKESIDTSYKKNLHLFEDYYYMMPKNLCIDKETTISYKKKAYEFSVSAICPSTKLRWVYLNNSKDDCSEIINLYKSKYGTPKIKENKESNEIEDKVITGILKISGKYNPEIHKKVTNSEFINYFKKYPFLDKYANEENSIYSDKCNLKFHLIKEDLVMKNISTGEFELIKVDLSREKFKYKKVLHYKTYTWTEGEKEITIKHLYRVEILNNLNYKKADEKFTSITYTSIKENLRKQRNIPINNDSIKKEELSTLDKI